MLLCKRHNMISKDLILLLLADKSRCRQTQCRRHFLCVSVLGKKIICISAVSGGVDPDKGRTTKPSNYLNIRPCLLGLALSHTHSTLPNTCVLNTGDAASAPPPPPRQNTRLPKQCCCFCGRHTKGPYPPGNWVKQLFWWGCRAARVTHSKGSRFAHLCKNRVWCHIQLCFTSLDLMARNTFITATAEIIDKWHTYPLAIQWAAAQRPSTTMLWVYYFASFPWSLLIAYLLFLHWDV